MQSSGEQSLGKRRRNRRHRLAMQRRSPFRTGVTFVAAGEGAVAAVDQVVAALLSVVAAVLPEAAPMATLSIPALARPQCPREMYGQTERRPLQRHSRTRRRRRTSRQHGIRLRTWIRPQQHPRLALLGLASAQPRHGAETLRPQSLQSI